MSDRDGDRRDAAADNPFRPPQAPSAPQGPTLVLPGWLLLLFAVGAILVPLAIDPDQPDAWVAGASYGAPCAIAVLIMAPKNLRLGRATTSSWIAIGLTAVAFVITALRIAQHLR